MNFNKHKTVSWIRQEYIYSNEDELYFLHGRNKNKVTTSLVYAAIKAGLFKKGWLLLNIFISYLTDNKPIRFEIVLVSKTNIITNYKDYIAVGVVTSNVIQIFVKSKHRRQGVGSAIINFFKMKKVKIGNACIGVKGSETFYNKNSVSIDK